jgi:hypothetical protein
MRLRPYQDELRRAHDARWLRHQAKRAKFACTRDAFLEEANRLEAARVAPTPGGVAEADEP